MKQKKNIILCSVILFSIIIAVIIAVLINKSFNKSGYVYRKPNPKES